MDKLFKKPSTPTYARFKVLTSHFDLDGLRAQILGQQEFHPLPARRVKPRLLRLRVGLECVPPHLFAVCAYFEFRIDPAVLNLPEEPISGDVLAVLAADLSSQPFFHYKVYAGSVYLTPDNFRFPCVYPKLVKFVQDIIAAPLPWSAG